MASTFRLTQLPADAVDPILCFFTGYDLLQLSHVTRQLYHEFLAPNGDVWQRLAPSDAPQPTRREDPGSPVRTRAQRKRRRDDDDDETKANHDDTKADVVVVRPTTTAKQRYCQRRSFRFYGFQDKSLGKIGPASGGSISCESLHAVSEYNGSFSIDMSFAL